MDADAVRAAIPPYRPVGGGPYPALQPGQEWRSYLPGQQYPHAGYHSPRELSRHDNDVGRLRAEAEHLSNREAFLETQLASFRHF